MDNEQASHIKNTVATLYFSLVVIFAYNGAIPFM